MRRRWRLVCLVLPLAAAGAQAASASSPATWPQYRGDGTGHVRAAGPLPTSWSEGHNIAWKSPVPGRGWSSPVVMDGKVWLSTAVEDHPSLRLVSFDMQNGRQVHDVELFRPQAWRESHADNSYASPTPAAEPGRVCVHFGSYGTACVSTDGEILWRRKTLELDYEVGPGSSPILWRDLLIVNCDATDAQLVLALHKETGETVWRTDRRFTDARKPPHRKAFSTPLVYYHAGQARLLSTGATHTSAYDPATGREIWWLPHDGYSNVPMPMVGLGKAFVDTGYMRPHLLAVPLGKEGPLDPDKDVLWSYYWQVPANPSPLLVGTRIYMVNDHGNATWLDAVRGEDIWRRRLHGRYYASPLLAGGTIYNFSLDGRTTLLRASDTFEELAVNGLDGQIRATPAAADRSLFIRTDRHLYRAQDLGQEAPKAGTSDTGTADTATSDTGTSRTSPTSSTRSVDMNL